MSTSLKSSNKRERFVIRPGITCNPMTPILVCVLIIWLWYPSTGYLLHGVTADRADTTAAEKSLLFLFASDAHLYPGPKKPDGLDDIEFLELDVRYDYSEISQDVKGPPGYCRLSALVETWSMEKNNAGMFFLGDMLEAYEWPSKLYISVDVTKQKKITSYNYGRYTNELKMFFEKIPGLSPEKKLYMIHGNNDSRTNHETVTFNNYIGKCTKTPVPLDDIDNRRLTRVWTDTIDDYVGLLGVYLPDKRKNIDDDTFFNLDALADEIDSNLNSLCNDKNLKLIILLTHQGFVEDEYWSMQREGSLRKGREGEKEEEKKEREELLFKWINFVKKVRTSLIKHDKDSGVDKNLPNIIVVFGHSHRGYFIRTPDKIEHISCPSLMEGDRASKRMNIGAFLKIKYYYEEPEKIEIIYDNIYNYYDQEPDKKRNAPPITSTSILFLNK